jgi:hypothetical protein
MKLKESVRAELLARRSFTYTKVWQFYAKKSKSKAKSRLLRGLRIN